MSNELELASPSSATLYALLRRNLDGQIYNGSTFEPWNSANLSTYILPLTDQGGDLYQADFPPNIPAGLYRLIYFRQSGGSGGSPATTDLLLASRDIRWTGSAVTTTPPTTLDPYALTSLADAKQFLRIDSDDVSDDTLLTALINQVSARVESICRRQFLARNYLERYDPPPPEAPDRTLLLRHRPVLSITRLAFGCAPALKLSFTAPALRASAGITQDQLGNPIALQLTTTATSGSPTVTTLAFTACPTTSSLATAAVAVTGWQSQLLANIPSVELNPIGALDALQSATGGSSGGGGAILTYPDRDLPHHLLNHRTGELSLPSPSQHTYSHDFHNTFVSPYAGAESSKLRILHPSHSQSLLIQYTAGYTTLPYDVEMVTLELVAQAYQIGKQNPTLARESFGDYSYSRLTLAALTADQSARLQPYVEIR